MLKLNDKVKVVENYDIEQMRNKQGIIVRTDGILMSFLVDFHERIIGCTHDGNFGDGTTTRRWFSGDELELISPVIIRTNKFRNFNLRDSCV